MALQGTTQVPIGDQSCQALRVPFGVDPSGAEAASVGTALGELGDHERQRRIGRQGVSSWAGTIRSATRKVRRRPSIPAG